MTKQKQTNKQPSFRHRLASLPWFKVQSLMASSGCSKWRWEVGWQGMKLKGTEPLYIHWAYLVKDGCIFSNVMTICCFEYAIRIGREREKERETSQASHILSFVRTIKKALTVNWIFEFRHEVVWPKSLCVWLDGIVYRGKFVPNV
jgi:hypothetical protein